MHIRSQSGVLQKVAFEARYLYGFTYLDRCGKTINRIMRDHPEWMIKGDSPNPQDGRLVSVKNGCSFVFSPYNYTFQLDMPTGGESLSEADLTGFVDQVDLISRIVNDYLELEVFTRIGVRTWHLFGFQSLSAATDWLNSLGYYSISNELLKAFEGTIDAATVTMLLTGTDRKFRLSFSSVERQAQIDLGDEILNIRASTLSKDQDKFLKQQMQVRRRVHSNPAFAALIDIDVFQEEPISIDPKDFIDTSINQYSERLNTAAKG